MADNVWYQDSVGITQISIIRSIQDDTKDTVFPETVGYRFVDMRKKWAYEYKSLSDTAQITKKYAKADSASNIGGWNFYRRSSIKFDSLQFVNDTSINGITYLKHRYVQYFQGRKLVSEILSRCDKKGSLFQLDVGVSNATGCPMVKGSELTPDGRFIVSSSDIEFISKEIPDSVQKVFAAWKRNVSKHPVE